VKVSRDEFARMGLEWLGDYSTAASFYIDFHQSGFSTSQEQKKDYIVDLNAEKYKLLSFAEEIELELIP